MDWEQLSAMAFIMGIGMFAGTVRYLKELGDNLQRYSWFRHTSHMVIGGFVAVMAGFITTDQGITGALQHAIVGLAAVSSRELLEFIPAAFRRFVQVKPW